MKTSKVLLILVYATSLWAQGVGGVTSSPVAGDPTIDYFSAVGSTPDGDTYIWSAWLSNTYKPLFPSTTGLPIIGAINDGHTSACAAGGNIELIQLSKIAPIGTTATSSNTFITPYTNCMTSFGASPGDSTAPAGTWNDSQSWKGFPSGARNGRLFMPVYRQTPVGDAFGGSTLTMSPDAGNTWIDYGRWNTFSITSATCSSSVVVLTLSGSSGLAGTEKVYVHDTTPTTFGGKQTLTAAVGSTVTYTLKDVFGATVACPAGSATGGNFGLLDPNGSAPQGPLGTGYPGNMMWPSGGRMVQVALIDYGQDGSLPAGVDAACDPAVYTCMIDMRNVGQRKALMALARVPLGQEMNKTSYQWYTCPGYEYRWTVMATVCDGNLAGSWSSTITDETTLMDLSFWGYGTRVGNCSGSVSYSAPLKLYVLSCSPEPFIFAGGRDAYATAPHAWGPWAQTYFGCNGNVCNSSIGFNHLMTSQEVILGTTPPRVQYRYGGGGSGGHLAGGTPYFSSIELSTGKVLATGMARHGDTYGDFGSANIGYRFMNGLVPGAIPRRGMSLPTTPIGGTFAPGSYSYCRLVNISGSMVSGGGTLTNFAVEVNLTDPLIRTVGNGGFVNSASGFDIGFGPDCSGSGASLAWDMESYDATAGTIVAHVKRPALTNSGDTIGMYFGGAQVTYQSTRSSVWTANYISVWNLADPTNPVDSLGANNGTNHGATAATGQVNGGANLAVSGSQYIDTGHAGTGVGAPITMDFWLKMNSYPSFALALSNASGVGYEVYIGDGSGGVGHNLPTFQLTGPGGTSTARCTSSLVVGTWYHVVAVSTGTTTGTMSMYVNGALQSFGSPTYSATSIGVSTDNFMIGKRPGLASLTMDGVMDNVRLSSDAKSADWILTEYRNQSSPGAYITEGALFYASNIAPPSVNQPTFSLQWWGDFYDHAGDTTATNRPYFMETTTGGQRYFTKYLNGTSTNAFSNTPNSAIGCTAGADCLTSTGPTGALVPSWNDTVFQGNSAWSFVGVVGTSGTSGVTGDNGPPADLFLLSSSAYPSGAFDASQFMVMVGGRTANDICVRYGSRAAAGAQADFCTPGGAYPTSAGATTVIATASPNLAGYPTITIYVGSAGVLTRYGGVSMAVSATGTTANLLTKTCNACSSAPNITAVNQWVATAPTGYGGYSLAIGEMGVFSGAITQTAASQIYRTLKSGWARWSRGVL